MLEILSLFCFVFFFYREILLVQGPGGTRDKRVPDKGRSLSGYVGNINVNPRHEQINIVVLGKTEHAHGSLFHRAAVHRRSLLDWKLLLT